MVLDTTVMNVSISQVVHDLHTSVSMVQLAITAYTLVMAAAMLTGAKLGDIWGRRRAFAIGLGIYGVGSLTTALSPNITVLLIGWSLVEGLGAALVVVGACGGWEQRVDRQGGTPLLRPDLLRVPQLRAGLSMVLSQYLILAGTFFVIPLYLQLVLGEDALHTGLKILPISLAMMLTALLGPRLATRMSPRRVVQIGLAFLFVSIIGLMATISPTLASVAFAASLAGFGAGIGLVISPLGNVVLSSGPGSRSSEAGGVQGAAQNLGQSLGTALIGAVLLTGLTSSFQDRVNANPAIPARVQQQVAQGTEEGVPMISQDQAKSIADNA